MLGEEEKELWCLPAAGRRGLHSLSWEVWPGVSELRVDLQVEPRAEGDPRVPSEWPC